MKDNPVKVTVVTVTFNAGVYLEETIQSVLTQDYSNIEYIIIDGGSTDGTQEIIKKYESEITHWVSESDRGIYHAMNKGIDASTGEWINFMNTGDCFASNGTLSTVIAQMPERADIVYGASNLVNPLTREKVYHPVKPLDLLLKPEMPFIHQSVLIRTDLIKQYGYREDYCFASDFDLFLKMYHAGHSYYCIDDLIVSDFLGGGIHAYHMPEYMSECINSLVEHHENPVEFAKSGGVTKACQWFYKEKKMEFSRSLGLIMLQLEELRKQYQRIVVYGYGSVGRIAVNTLQGNVTCCIDRAVNDTQKEGVEFVSIDMLPKKEYDIILITVLGRETEILHDLVEYGVKEEKIVSFHL